MIPCHIAFVDLGRTPPENTILAPFLSGLLTIVKLLLLEKFDEQYKHDLVKNRKS